MSTQAARVWVLHSRWEYELDTVDGVYTTLEAAQRQGERWAEWALGGPLPEGVAWTPQRLVAAEPYATEPGEGWTLDVPGIVTLHVLPFAVDAPAGFPPPVPPWRQREQLPDPPQAGAAGG